MGSLVICECPSSEDFPTSLIPEVSMLDEAESADNINAFVFAVDACDGPGNLREGEYEGDDALSTLPDSKFMSTKFDLEP